MRIARQLVALLQMSLGSLRGRMGPSLVTLVGTACVVGVLVSMLAMGVGARRMAVNGAKPDDAVVQPSAEGGGGRISKQDAAIIESEPGIRHDAEGRPMAGAIV